MHYNSTAKELYIEINTTDGYVHFYLPVRTLSSNYKNFKQGWCCTTNAYYGEVVIIATNSFVKINAVTIGGVSKTEKSIIYVNYR